MLNKLVQSIEKYEILCLKTIQKQRMMHFYLCTNETIKAYSKRQTQTSRILISLRIWVILGGPSILG